MFDLESNIRSWSDLVREKGNCTESDLLELEDHLRDEIEDLTKRGLTQDEAFLISIKRLGNVNAISNEYSKINSENFWKYLMMDSNMKIKNRHQILLLIIFSVLAGTLFKIPEILGYSFNELFYFKNLTLFILPFVTLYFIIKRKLNWKISVTILGIFLISALIINIYPSYNPNNTVILTGIHLPIFLWLMTGITYIGSKWKDSKDRMNFIRFTGESFIYGVLITCGVGVLCAFTMLIFSAIGIDLETFVTEYLIIYGMCGAVMITLYLVEAKKSIVENFAPILAKIFSPLFLITMVTFLIVMIFTGKSPFVDRNFLIGFDLMLVLVLGLVLYVISARNLHDRKNIFDYINLALIITALIIDLVALTAILVRLQNFGITPNKVAALGENLVLLVNLVILSWQYIRYLTNKIEFKYIEKCQTSYLTIYAIWLGIVAFIFPLLFGFK
ncbi:MAG: putative rane protein [Haloplasmataceae bacterium]|jgi:hypothetical protein|nr:putative rane protein [Haloplasmataceae bacterium]